MTDLIHAHLIISGTVQGVGYRMAAEEMAAQLGVAGWVRNLPNGGVEAVFEGEEDPVEDMIGWCQQGPPSAVVHNVEIEYGEPQGLQGFEVRR